MRSIYEPKGRAEEYSPLALNLYTGCPFGCVYCFNTKTPWCDKAAFAKPRLRDGILEATEKAAQKLSGDPREILLCFGCDPYPGEPLDLMTRAILLILEKAKLRVQILTKAGTGAARDFDILARNKWRYGISLSCNDPDVLEYEPHAAPVGDRLRSLARAHYSGIPTFISFEPVIDTEFCISMIRSAPLQDVCDEFRIGKMNYMKTVKNKIDWTDFLRRVRAAAGTKKLLIKKGLLKHESENTEDDFTYFGI